MNFVQKEISYLEEKKSLWILGKGKVDVTGFWKQKKSFSTQEVDRKMIFP